MNDSITSQLYSLVIYFFSGFIIAIFFDVFRILRRTFRTSDLITYLEDFIFWIITGEFLIFVLFNINNGELRIYNFLGMGLGMLIYMLYISKFFIKFNVKILVFLKETVYKIVKFISYPIKFVFFRIKKLVAPITFFVINLRKKSKKQKNIKIKEGF